MGERLRAVGPDMARRLEWLRGWSRRLDSAFTVPGTSLSFGWDPVLGLFPGLGDLVTPVFSIAIIVTGAQLGIPRLVQARMVLNVVIDALVGAVPLLGDVFDAGWKANEWNMELLERHAWTELRPSSSDWMFVGGAVALVGVAAAVPVVLFAIAFELARRLAG